MEPLVRVIEADIYVQYGCTLPFQQADLPLPDYLPAPTGDMVTWDESQYLLVITTGATLGAVGFRAEELPLEPPMEESGWTLCQEVSTRFETADVVLRDLENDQTLVEGSLISRPGRYRIRLYSVGRDSGVELQEAGEDLTERYLMQLWPEERERPPTALRRFD